MRTHVNLVTLFAIACCVRGHAPPPDAVCHGLSGTIEVSPEGVPPQEVSVLLPPNDVSLSAWVYNEATDDVPTYNRFLNIMNLHGRDTNGYEMNVGLAQPSYLPPLGASDMFLVYDDIDSGQFFPRLHSPWNFTVPTMTWTLLTLSIGKRYMTVFVNESVAWHVERSASSTMYVGFSDVSFEKPYSYPFHAGSTQTYAGIQLYKRALAEADVVARVRGDPSACSPAPPPFLPPPPFAQSPPSPPFASAPPLSACIAHFTPVWTFTEACYVALPQPRLVCNGTRVAVGCGNGAVARLRFPGRSDIRAVSRGACDLTIDTVSSTTIVGMLVEVACTDARCEPRPIIGPLFSLSGQCETVPVVEKEIIDVPHFNASMARILFPSKRPIAANGMMDVYEIHIQLEHSLLYLPLPETLCPGSVVYAWLPCKVPKPWVVGCGTSGVCAPMFNYPAQNASIPYNNARINGLFEASADVTTYGVTRLRMVYTGREPLVNAPNTALQLSLQDTADDVYYGISESVPDLLGDRTISLPYQNIIDIRFVGAAIDGPTQCERIQNQTARCIPQPGVTTCARVCAQSHVEVSTDGLSPDTVIVVFGVVRLTADSPYWAGMTVSDTTADVECAGTCGMAALSYSWITPPGGCPPSGGDTSPAGRFLCASNAVATHGAVPTTLCDVKVQAGQVVELWADYVSFHSATITIANETFVLEAPVPPFREDDAEINPGCPVTKYNSFIDTKRLAPLRGATWSGASKPLDAGVYSIQLQSLKRRHVSTALGCKPSDVVATVHAVVRYPDPPAQNVTLCTSASPCVVSDTTLASVSTYAVSIQTDGEGAFIE